MPTINTKTLLAKLAFADGLKAGDPVRLTAQRRPTLLRLTLDGQETGSVLQLDLPAEEAAVPLDATVSRAALRQSLARAGQTVTLEANGSAVAVSSEGKAITDLAVLADNPPPELAAMPKGTTTLTLPTNFGSMFLRAASCASDDPSRPALRGVQLSPEGVTATDGKQLFHLPLPLQLTAPAILPASKQLSKLAASSRWVALSLWRTKENKPRFRLTGEDFIHEGNAIDAPYPNWRSIVPPDTHYDMEAKFPAITAKAICDFAKELKRNTQCAVTFSGNFVHFDSMEGARSLTARAECSSYCKIHLDLAYLAQLLRLGHDGIRLSSTGRLPLMGVGGQGIYIFMPLGAPAASAASAPSAPQPSQSTQTVPSNNTQTVPTQTNPQEKSHMSIAPAPMPTAPAVSKPAANPSPLVSQDPAERLAALISEMRTNLTNLENQMAEAQRKLREIAVSQKAKERQYADAVRKLERIRLAV